MTDGNNFQAADSLIGKIDRLHSSPKIAQQILSLTRDPDFEMRDVVACLEKDPALAAKLLRLVNSSRYGLAHHVTSIRHAAAYLGRRSLRLTTLTFALVESLTHGIAAEIYSDFWKRSLTLGSVCSQLAKRDSGFDRDDAYTAGLMADIGVLVLAQFEGDRYQPIYSNSPHDARLIEAERKEFDFGHPMLGARLLQNWDVPEGIVMAVANHHQRPETLESLDLLVCTANLIADALWQPDCPYVLKATRMVQQHFGLDMDGFIELAVNCRTDIEEVAGVFNVEGCDSLNCEQFNDEVRRVHASAALESALEIDELEATINDLCSEAPR